MRRIVFVLLVLVACAGPLALRGITSSPGSVQAAGVRPNVGSDARSRCENLRALKMPDTTIEVAQLVPARAYKPGADYPPPARLGAFTVLAPADLPEFCRVTGVIRPAQDSEIKFEVWMPTSEWNGRFVGVGNGGFAGLIFDFEMSDPLAHHYATASTNLGHDGGPQDGRFAVGHPEKVIDYGYRATHETTVKAKRIVAAFYGKPPAFSYFTGCSGGGRQALMEAQRFPSDYDGIAAGDPSISWTHGVFAGLFRSRTADGNSDGRLPRSKVELLHKAVLQACDGLDGVVDGILEAPDRCNFDPKVLECQGEDRPTCLTTPQVELVRSFYSPVRSPRTGQEISPGMPYGAEVLLASPDTERAEASGRKSAANIDYLRYAIFHDADWNEATSDLDSDLARADRLDGNTRNAGDPNLRPFFAKGGKLLHYNGWTEGSAFGSIDYYKGVVDYFGGARRIDASYRLFMLPGIGHCGRDDGLRTFATFDAIGALEQWVEHGKAPDEIIASHWAQGKVDRTRPLCPYPKVAKYKGTGSTDDAANFVCAAR